MPADGLSSQLKQLDYFSPRSRSFSRANRVQPLLLLFWSRGLALCQPSRTQLPFARWSKLPMKSLFTRRRHAPLPMRSSADNGVIDLGVQMVPDAQTIYESNWFQSFHTFKTFQSFSISERSNRSRRSNRLTPCLQQSQVGADVRCGCSRCRSSVKSCRIWS